MYASLCAPSVAAVSVPSPAPAPHAMLQAVGASPQQPAHLAIAEHSLELSCMLWCVRVVRMWGHWGPCVDACAWVAAPPRIEPWIVWGGLSLSCRQRLRAWRSARNTSPLGLQLGVPCSLSVRTATRL